MIIKIDFESEEAIYIQLRNQIIMGIATDRIHEGDSLPSVRQLAENIGINMNTVNNMNNINNMNNQSMNVNCNTPMDMQRRSSCTNIQPMPLSQRNNSCNIVADKHALMKNIYELGFILTETNLYLDTHPNDMEAIEYYAQIRDKYCNYMTKYADYYGPLDKLHISNDNYWMWVSTPMPWEMEVC